MKSKNVIDIIFWTLTVLWCCVIFGFSAEKGEDSGGTSGRVCTIVAKIFVSDFEDMSRTQKAEIIENMQFFIRKTAHFIAYLVLGFLSSMALRSKPIVKRGGISLVFTFMYAVSDEIHQYFVPDRACRFPDVLIDTAGGLCGIVISALILQALKLLLSKRRRNNG